MKGLSQDAAGSRISMFDVNGLLEPSRSDLSLSQKVYAHNAAPSKDLVQTIETVKPTISDRRQHQERRLQSGRGRDDEPAKRAPDYFRSLQSNG